MSSGRFSREKYESNQGTIHPIRIQPETLTASLGGAANSAPAGALTAGALSARATGSSRQIGLTARKVYFVWDVGAEPPGYKEEASGSIVVLTQARFNALSIGSVVSYLGGTGKVTGLKPEGRR